MKFLALIFILTIFIILLIASIIWQMREAGIKVKDFASFIKATQNLDDLYVFAKKYEQMSPQEQIMYLSEAERMFKAFDRIPRTVWEDEEDKYDEVLETYKNIRVMRWNEAQEYSLSKKVKPIIPKSQREN